MAKSTPDQAPQLDGSPSHLLHRVLQLALDIYAVETGPGALTQRQYAVLAAVAANEGASQTWLVGATGIDRSTLADLVGRMIVKGYLARERSPDDARANTVKLATAGRDALVAAAPKVEAADARILSILGPKKRDPFVEALRRLARAGDGAPPPVIDSLDAPKTKKKKGLKKKQKKAKRRLNGDGVVSDVDAPAEPAAEATSIKPEA
jgi:DNA-binding MarR family transcriptional regulator